MIKKFTVTTRGFSKLPKLQKTVNFCDSPQPQPLLARTASSRLLRMLPHSCDLFGFLFIWDFNSTHHAEARLKRLKHQKCNTPPQLFLPPSFRRIQRALQGIFRFLRFYGWAGVGIRPSRITPTTQPVGSWGVHEKLPTWGSDAPRISIHNCYLLQHAHIHTHNCPVRRQSSLYRHACAGAKSEVAQDVGRIQLLLGLGGGLVLKHTMR